MSIFNHANLKAHRMSTKPYLYYSDGLWNCESHPLFTAIKSKGVGSTPSKAYRDYISKCLPTPEDIKQQSVINSRMNNPSMCNYFGITKTV